MPTGVFSTPTRSDCRSFFSRLPAIPRHIRRPVLLILVLGIFGSLAVTTNFMLMWRATSGSSPEKYLLNFWENVGSTISEDSIMRNGKDQNWDMQRMEKKLVYTIHQIAQRTVEKRGIVLPLFDGIATMGLSLILELRSMNVTVPIEVPHCGDLKESIQHIVLGKIKEIGVIRFYDVCQMASQTTSFLDKSRKVFCQDLQDCHRRYRNFKIKLLAVIFSQFEEIMLLDADTLFFECPISLWDTDKYRGTGTLFFHDRLSQDKKYSGKRIQGDTGINELNHYISQFDVSPFALLDYIMRPKATSENKIPVELKNYSPSEHLLISHSWNQRAGHEMDSSLLLWNKKRQPRATAILGAFVALNDIDEPPSYGDKELYFVAAELAETQYAFSDFGVGGVGSDFRDNGPDKSVVCGHASHYYPVKPADDADVANTSLLYLNSDAILEYDPKKPLYFSQARPYQVYAGSFEERGLRQECPFDVTGIRFSSTQVNRFVLRQRFHEIVVDWIDSTQST